MKNRTKRKLLIFAIIGVGLMIVMSGTVIARYMLNKDKKEVASTEASTTEQQTSELPVYRVEIEATTQATTQATTTENPDEISAKDIPNKITETTTQEATSEATTGQLEEAITTETAAETKKNNKIKRASILVGDSRFVNFKKYTSIDSDKNIYLVAKVSMGYDWLKDTAVDEIEKIKKKHKDVDVWNIVFCLGVNDLYNKDNYASFYNDYDEKYDNDNIIICSVSQVEDPSDIDNKDIEEFNDTLYATGFSYIDTYYELSVNGFKTNDGVHYDEKTTKFIYTIIQNFLDYFN